MTIASRVAAMAAQPADPVSESIRAVFAAEQAGLAAGGTPPSVAEPGFQLPDVALLDPLGVTTTLSSAVAGLLAVVVLYRGGWCPYCNLALKTYESELLPRLEEHNAVLIAVSPQRPDGSLSVQQKHDLHYPVLSDPGNQIGSQLGVVTGPSPEARGTQLRLGLDLADVNADGTTALPMPTTIIVDQILKLLWIDVHPDYSTRSEPDDILAALAAAMP
jgi:peroxiredoxin